MLDVRDRKAGGVHAAEEEAAVPAAEEEEAARAGLPGKEGGLGFRICMRRRRRLPSPRTKNPGARRPSKRVPTSDGSAKSLPSTSRPMAFAASSSSWAPMAGKIRSAW